MINFLLWNKQARSLGRFDDYLLLPGNILYASIPKAANTTIKHMFLDRCKRLTDSELLCISKDSQAIHRLLKKHYGIPKEQFFRLALQDQYFCFSVLRDPIQRFFSFYRDKILNNGWPIEMYSRIEKAYGLHAGQSFRKVVNLVCKIPDHLAEIHFRSQYDILGGSSESLKSIRLYKLNEIHKLVTDLDSHLSSDISIVKDYNTTSTDFVNQYSDLDIDFLSSLVKRYSYDYAIIELLNR